jgi:hypothetical protein
MASIEQSNAHLISRDREKKSYGMNAIAFDCFWKSQAA